MKTTCVNVHNKVTAGEFWAGRVPSSPELSVEEGFAEDLGWKLGDQVAFDIAGQRFEGRITSLRSVDWESFRPNFFVVASPGALDGYSASYITAVSVPSGDAAFTRELVYSTLLNPQGSLIRPTGPVALVERDTRHDYCQWHVLDQWRHLATLDDPAQLETALQQPAQPFSLDAYHILLGHLRRHPDTEVVLL